MSKRLSHYVVFMFYVATQLFWHQGSSFELDYFWRRVNGVVVSGGFYTAGIYSLTPVIVKNIFIDFTA